MSIRATCLLLALLAATLPPSSLAQGSPAAPAATLPAGKEVVERFIRAIGGKEALAGIKNAVMVMAVSAPAQGISGTMTARLARPDLVHAVTEIEGIGRMEQGYDGTVGWSSDAIMGPRLLDGAELASFKRQSADVLTWSNVEETFERIETKQRTTFDGHDAWEVLLATTDGYEITAWFDVESGLEVGMALDAASPIGKLHVVSTMGDYADFEGVKLARRMSAKTMGIEQVLKLVSVKWNVPEMAPFVPPAEVQALLAPAAPTPAAPKPQGGGGQ